jgi:hypothetical protein
MPDGSIKHELGFGAIAHARGFYGLVPNNANVNMHYSEGLIGIRTQDATPTMLIDIASGASAVANLTVKVIARKSDNSIAGSWHKGITVKWDGSFAATDVGASYDVAAEQGSSGYTVTLSIASAVIRCEVTGAAASNVDWFGRYEYLALDEAVA